MLKIFAVLACGLVLTSYALFEPLRGKWSNKQGQTMIFGKDDSCLWIFNMDGITDSFEVPYKYQKLTKDSGLLDLGPFSRGMLKGKTLFGILAWDKQKRHFRYDAEPGKQASVRPKSFNPAQVQVYEKVK